MVILSAKDTGKWFNHKSSYMTAVIGNPRANRYKIMHGHQWSLEDWCKIVDFYKNHEFFTIELKHEV